LKVSQVLGEGTQGLNLSNGIRKGIEDALIKINSK